MTIEQRLEKLAGRTPAGRPADVLAGARARAAGGTAGRRSSGRRMLVAVAVAAVLAVGVFVSISGNDGETVVAGPDEHSSSGDLPTGTLRVESITVAGTGVLVEGGTGRAVIDFNEPLPTGEARYVADIASAEPADGLVYTTQGPHSTHLCNSVHSVPESGVGSVDLLVPASWFAQGDATHLVPELEDIDNPAKFPICGPYNGFIQYSMWAPLSADPDDVTVTVASDRRSLTIQTARSGSETAP